MDNLEYKIEPKENFYFALKVIFGLAGYVLFYYIIKLLFSNDNFMSFVPLLVYIPIILLVLFFRMGLLIGYLKGNSIKVTDKQFSDLNKIVEEQCRTLGMQNVPDVYILQNGGLLNAFAARFMGSNYIVLYSDIVEEAYENNYDSLAFIIGHELGHVKRKHMIKSLIFFPSIIVPFLNGAYSRACEYTCDSIGFSLKPKGAQPGILLLAAGKKIWQKVNVDEFIKQEQTEIGFWSWFAEKVSTHPKLTKRLMRFDQLTPVIKKQAVVESVKVQEIKSDHSSYMPN